MSKHVFSIDPPAFPGPVAIRYSRIVDRAPRRAGVLLVVVGLLLCGAGHARKSDREQPADIDAGHFVGEMESGVREFSEGFNLRQGTLNVDAEKATVYVDAGGQLERVVLLGDPVVWREELDSGESLHARAGEIDYDFQAARAILKQDVVIDRGANQISGDLVRYDLDTQRLDAGEGEGRVRMRITPADRSGADDDS